jgi:PAS domain S-box-containing protein
MMKDKTVILVVDDQPQNIELLEAHLVPQGYEIVTAASGEEALGKLSGHPIDLILLDVMMPGIDGIEVTRRVRQDNTYRRLPIILVTSLREPEDRVKGIEAGCDDFISKPFDKMELLVRVRSLLKAKAYNDLMSHYRKELESEITSRTEELKHTVENLQQENAERKLAEEELLRTNTLLSSIVENIPNMIFLKEAKDLRFVRFNRAGEDLLGYSRDDLMGKNDYDFFPKEQADFFTEKDRDVMHGKEVMDIQEETIQTRNKGERTLHTKKVPILNAEGKPEYLLGISEDITDGKKAEERLKETLESLRRAVKTTIQVMVSAVETRDPYTSGHQLRSANLARAIATELGLPPEKIEGLWMAGSIHDVGKLSIPAEILSKPTKLSPIELSLIKEHASRGYEILKGVESSWPLAEIVHQHHERMDGSGYPGNLKGEEILIEARILTVADVVEAMASHRPYRPGLGINAALDEIEKNSGIFYDDAVADACLRLFREKGFQLEGTCF